jgi:hypothetical protein
VTILFVSAAAVGSHEVSLSTSCVLCVVAAGHEVLT